MPRRVADYADEFADWNFFISIASFALGASTIVFLYNMIVSWARGPIAPGEPVAGADARVAGHLAAADLQLRRDPAGRRQPVRVRRARRAPRGAERRPRRRARRGARAVRHVLVVANETVAGRAADRGARSSAPGRRRPRHGRLPRSTPPSAGYVVYEDTRRAAAGRRLDRTLRRCARTASPRTGSWSTPIRSTRSRDALAQLEPPVDEIVVSTHPKQKSGWLRKNVLEKIEKAARRAAGRARRRRPRRRGRRASERARGRERDRRRRAAARADPRARAARSPASFLLVSPQNDPTLSAASGGRAAPAAGARRAARRGDRRARPDRAPGPVHGRRSRPSATSASTRSSSRPSRARSELAGCAATWSTASARRPGCRSSTSSSARRGRRRRASDDRARGRRARPPRPADRAPELARQRAGARDVPLHRLRGDALRLVLHGVLLRPRRRRSRPSGRPRASTCPVFVAGVNTAILLTSSFTMHWALQSIKRGSRAGLQAGLVLTLAMGLTFLLTQMLEYARIGFAPHDGAFGSVFYGLTGLHGAHVFVGLTLLTRRHGARFPRPLHPGAPPRRRDARNLLALRRRNVDRRVRDGLPPLGRRDARTRSAARPRRSASSAAVGYFAAIVLAKVAASERGGASSCSSS